jgi:hypothetical protein
MYVVTLSGGSNSTFSWPGSMGFPAAGTRASVLGGTY